MIAVFSIVLFATYKPYIDDTDDFLQTACQVQIFFSYFVGLLLMANRSGGESGRFYTAVLLLVRWRCDFASHCHGRYLIC